MPSWIPTLAAVAFLAAADPTLPRSPLPATEKAQHLLNRLAFGPRPGEVEALAKGGDAALQAWIRRQMEPGSMAETALVPRLEALRSLAMDIPEAQAAYPRPEAAAQRLGLARDDPDFAARLREKLPVAQRPARLEEDLAAAKLLRAVEGERQLEAVLTDFWFNHFNVDLGKGEDRWFLASYERDAIRPRLFGRFRDLLGATTRHPAMLWYLDNWMSVREGFTPPRPGARAHWLAADDPRRPQPAEPTAKLGLNENYARELLELHTLGVDGGYTQADVREVARCFTGWSIDKPREAARYRFRPLAHDPDPKKVLGRTIDGGGEQDGEAVLDLLARHPSTARFLATKLCRRFVSEAPPAALVDRVAKRFLDTEGDLRAVYWTLFTSPEFWAPQACRTKIRTPLEFAAAAVRALGGRLEDPLPLARRIARLGQPLYHCPPPTGYPDTAEAWINAGALVGRMRFGLELAANRLPGVRWEGGPLLAELPHPADPAAALASFAARVLHREPSPATRASILAEIPADQWTGPTGAVRPEAAAKLLGLVLGSPEFQGK